MQTTATLLASALRWLIPRLPLIGGVALLTLALALSCGPRRTVRVSGPSQPTRVDTVTKVEYIASKPDTVIGKVERIVRPPVRPERITVAVGAGQQAVAGFCAPSRTDTIRIASVDSTKPDSIVEVVTPPFSAVLANGLRYQRRLFGTGRLTLYTVRNDSSVASLEYRVGNWNYTGALEGGQAVVQGDRFGAAKTWAERGIIMGLSATAGYLIGSARH